MKSWVVMFSLALSGLAQAQITPELAAEFMRKQTLELYPNLTGDRIDILKLMRAAPPGDAMSIVPLLAKQWNATEAGAAKVIEAVMIEETRERAFVDREVRARIDSRISRLYGEAFELSQDSPQIWGLSLDQVEKDGRCGDTALRANYLARPVAKAQYPRQRHCRDWYVEFARRYPDSVVGRVQMHIAVRDDDPAAEIATLRWALEALEARREPDDFERAVRQWHWSLLAQHGLGDELLAEVAANARRYASPFAKPAHEKLGMDDVVVFNDWMLTSQAAGARAGWLLALLEAGRGDEARAAFDAALDGEGETKDALFGNTKDDLFERYLADPEKSLLWKGIDGRLVDRGVARFLAANGMESAARHAAQRSCRTNEPDDSGPAREVAGLPAEFLAHHERYRRLIASAESRANCPSATREINSTRLPRYPELPLTAEERGRPVFPGLEMKIPLPESFGLVRAEKRGDDVLALCESSAVDPSGEIGVGGYWLLRSRDGGKNWSAPRYLGLQARSPYLAKHEARISMFAGDALRIEADVAELDPESITFPPIGLRNRRKVPDIRIDIPFADIERDTDGDGWTDLLEAKLHTDPANADTDGDGLVDALDDFPHASARGTPDPDAALIVDLLKRIMGFERAGIVEPVDESKGSKAILRHLSGMRRPGAGSVLFQIVAGDAARFAGLRAESQIIVLSEAQLREIRETSGPFYPLEFPEILFDARRERAVVTWSAGWVGGTLLYRKANGRWKGEEVSRWITGITPTPRTSPG